MENNKEKKVNIPLIITIILVMTTVIVGVVLYSNKDLAKKLGIIKNEAQIAKEEQKQIVQMDMNNTENAKIVEGEKVNTSSNITKDREVEGLKLTNVKLQTEMGTSNFRADVKNDTNSNFEGGEFVIKFKDKSGNVFETLEARVPKLDKGETGSIGAGTTADVVNAYDIEISLIK